MANTTNGTTRRSSQPMPAGGEMANEPVKVAYLCNGVYVMRVLHGGALGAWLVCKAESEDWAGRICNALQVAEKERADG